MDVLENAQNFSGLMSRLPNISTPLETNNPPVNVTARSGGSEEDDSPVGGGSDAVNVETISKTIKAPPIVYDSYNEQKDSNVKLLQTSLNKIPIFDEIQRQRTPLVVDGQLGPNTYATLNAYQAQNNFVKRNWVDEDVARSLNASNVTTTPQKIAVNRFELSKLISPDDRFVFEKPSKEDRNQVRGVQQVMTELNFIAGTLGKDGYTYDGIWGPKTERAWFDYLESLDISVATAPTYEEQFKAVSQKDPKNFKGTSFNLKENKPDQDLVTSMLQYAGIHEDPNVNSVVHRALRNAIGFDPDITPWCAAIVGEVLKQSNFDIQNPVGFDVKGPSYKEKGSVNWENAGKRIASTIVKGGKNIDSSTTEVVQPGDIIVFSKRNRTSPDGSFVDKAKGHLGVIIHRYESGEVVVLGGNQDNGLRVTRYSLPNIEKSYPGGYVINRASGLANVDPEIVSNLLNSFGKTSDGSDL